MASTASWWAGTQNDNRLSGSKAHSQAMGDDVSLLPRDVQVVFEDPFKILQVGTAPTIYNEILLYM
jgi:hypothetical protein